ncbi:HPP family-domain-containing protein [Sordaria brevicollis]|uniref:HPP family-domain-containing protein n=1 Tax=Sordaria brevicollis TaxID=83679 RepID=A0AAE0UET6_SORBR|nr:HPP family-domain-containing protein [Sordaria brevicollis]
MPKPWYHHRPTTWHFNIDTYLNPLIPASILPHFPYPIAYFLGYRDPKQQQKRPPPGNVAVIFFAFVGIFVTLTVIGAVGRYYESFVSRGVPVVVGSFGAAAVLDFYAIESPLSQPRNAILGQLLSCIVGISIAKLFSFSPHFESIRFVGASLACASATAVMALTGTVHPPAGATALMAVLDDKVMALGWYLIAVVMLGCGVMLGCALVVNNLRRRFPFYWWSPEPTGQFWAGKPKRGDGEVVGKKGGSGSGSEETVKGSGNEEDKRLGGTSGERLRQEDGDVDIEAQSGRITRKQKEEDVDVDEGPRVVITRRGVEIPEGVNLRPEEVRFLETLAERL